jgi:hypothetical protein
MTGEIMDPQRVPPSNRRRSRRKAARAGARVTCRAGTMGLGPDIAVALFDASEEGLTLILKVPLAAKDEVEIVLSPPGYNKPLKRFADVVWSAPREGGGHWMGCKLRKRLSYAEFQSLT